MSYRPTGFKEVNLEETHGESIRAHQNNNAAVNNYQRFIEQRPKPTQIQYICRKIKNSLLMLPALFILIIILFVNFNTLFLGLPYRLSIASNNITKYVNILLSILFTISSIISISSFIKCVFTSSHVKDNPPKRLVTGDCRKCHKCYSLKPERAHHCSICQECTLKMDHHCPWVSNCVGYYNYKYFVLFVLFSTLGCHISSIICITQLYFLISKNGSDYTGPHSEAVMINSLLTLAFGITLTFFIGFHLVLLFSGSTTIEFGQSKHYSMGWKKNFESVMGTKPLYWFIPVQTALGDGYEWMDNQHLLNDNEDPDTDSESS